MAPPPFSSSSYSTSPHLPPHRSHCFTPILEGSENEDEGSERRRTTPSPKHHYPTPLHPSPATTADNSASAGSRRTGKRRPQIAAVTCNNCRPNSRDKTTSSVVPVTGGVNKDHSSSYSLSMPSPNGMFKSILCTLSRRSPKPPSSEAYSASSSAAEERWKIAAAELSQKLVDASRKRDEAILEASRFKYSVVELENKLDKLGIQSGGGITDQRKLSPLNRLRFDGHDQIVENFRFFVSEARAAVRSLNRALMVQIRQTSVKVFDRISSLLHPYDIRFSQSENPRTLIFYLEALLNASLFEDFESAGFMKSSTNRLLNPIDRCEAQYAAFNALKGLTWEEVLSKGTKHFSEDFSRFCDRKMSEIVSMLGWNRAWTEPLLQAFFGASKGVWLVHLLANSVHPGLTIFRVENGSSFESVYMEDMDVDRAGQRLDRAVVRIMVAPGFYVYDNVIKCKVLCKYTSNRIAHLGANGGGTHER